MKRMTTVLAALILLSSCYGYRRAARDFESFKEGDRVKLVLNHQTRKGKFKGIQNDTLILLRQSGKVDKIATTEILEIKRGKISILKSVLYPAASIGVVGFGTLIVHGFEWDFDWGN